MRESTAAAIIFIALVAIVSGALVGLGVYTWQDSQDKRACRRAGGAVVELEHGEWHCVGATPEAR